MRALRSIVGVTVFVACGLQLAGCGNDNRPGSAAPGGDTGTIVFDTGAPDTATPKTDGGTTDSAVPPTDGDATVPDDAADDGADTGSPDDAFDLDVILAETCSTPYMAFGTKSLVAGGMTPAAFATAWNAEVAKMTYPGPLLLAFTGVNAKVAANWKLKLGPLALEGAGPNVKFAATPAEVPFTMGTSITLTVPDAVATFTMRFATDSTTVDLPASGVRVTGSAPGCTELSVDSFLIMIPESAKDLPFAGSTVGALMGSPISGTGDAGTASFFVLELMGSSTDVTVAGGAP